MIEDKFQPSVMTGNLSLWATIRKNDEPISISSDQKCQNCWNRTKSMNEKSNCIVCTNMSAYWTCLKPLKSRKICFWCDQLEIPLFSVLVERRTSLFSIRKWQLRVDKHVKANLLQRKVKSDHNRWRSKWRRKPWSKGCWLSWLKQKYSVKSRS